VRTRTMCCNTSCTQQFTPAATATFARSAAPLRLGFALPHPSKSAPINDCPSAGRPSGLLLPVLKRPEPLSSPAPGSYRDVPRVELSDDMRRQQLMSKILDVAGPRFEAKTTVSAPSWRLIWELCGPQCVFLNLNNPECRYWSAKPVKYDGTPIGCRSAPQNTYHLPYSLTITGLHR
jgi:hypothetical protein